MAYGFTKYLNRWTSHTSKISHFVKRSAFTLVTLLITKQCFADGGTDILAAPAANLFATFKGTGVALLIVAEIVGAYAFYRKTGDMKAWIGLPILLIVTGWAATKF